jgi:hypothetical protein
MEAHAKSLTFLGIEHEIVIPYFQRRYVWDTPDWDKLFTDLLRRDRPHFLGSIILKQLGGSSGGTKPVSVIDGQQRLTTLCLLLKALADSFAPAVQKNIAARLQPLLFHTPDPTRDEHVVKIRHSLNDVKDYEYVITNGSALDLATLDDDSPKILRCYKFFRERIAAISATTPAVISELFIRLTDTKHELLVVIDLTIDDDEQAIFDTINSAGVRLSGADIVKNALFARARFLVQGQDVLWFERYWRPLFESDGEAQAYWATPRSTGRLMRDNLEILLQSVAIIEGILDPDADTLTDLPKRYKDHIATCDAAQLKGLLERLVAYGTLYRDRMHIDPTSQVGYADGEERLLHILHSLEISTLYPYVLHLMRIHGDNQTALTAAYRPLERLVMTRLICGLETKSYNKRCKHFISDPSAIFTANAEATDAAVVAALDRISNYTARVVLFWVELHRRAADQRRSEKTLVFNHQLEHIMPQKWKEHWSTVPVVDRSGQPVTDTVSAEAERTRAIYGLGNMTLLNGRLNATVSNQPLEVKINGQGRKRGINSYSDLSITRDDLLNPFLKGATVWDEQRIQARTAALATEVVQLWGEATLP